MKLYSFSSKNKNIANTPVGTRVTHDVRFRSRTGLSGTSSTCHTFTEIQMSVSSDRRSCVWSVSLGLFLGDPPHPPTAVHMVWARGRGVVGERGNLHQWLHYHDAQHDQRYCLDFTAPLQHWIYDFFFWIHSLKIPISAPVLRGEMEVCWSSLHRRL